MSKNKIKQQYYNTAINYCIGATFTLFKNPTVDLNVAVTSLIVLIISGAFAGLIPATKAVSVLPVEALRAT